MQYFRHLHRPPSAVTALCTASASSVIPGFGLSSSRYSLGQRYFISVTNSVLPTLRADSVFNKRAYRSMHIVHFNLQFLTPALRLLHDWALYIHSLAYFDHCFSEAIMPIIFWSRRMVRFPLMWSAKWQQYALVDVHDEPQSGLRDTYIPHVVHKTHIYASQAQRWYCRL